MTNVKQSLTKAKTELRRRGLLGEIELELVLPRYELHFLGYDPQIGEPLGSRWYDTELKCYCPDGFEPPAEEPDPPGTFEIVWPEDET